MNPQYAAQAANPEVLNWVNSALAAHLKKNEENMGEVEHIIDYLNSDAAPKRLLKMSYAQARTAAAKWNAALVKKGKGIVEAESDTDTFIDFGDGFRFVRLIGQKAYAMSPIVLPTICPIKARAFFEFRSGQYVAGEGYIPYRLMAIMVDEATMDTVAYFDFVRDKGDYGDKYVVSIRYEVISGRVVSTWRSKEKCCDSSDYIAIEHRATQYLQEVARLCGF